MMRRSSYAQELASERRSEDKTAKIRRRVGRPKPEIQHVRFLTVEQLEHVKKAAEVSEPPESLPFFGAIACLERADRILGYSVKPAEEVPA